MEHTEGRTDVAGLGFELLGLGHASRRGDALSSLDSTDLNILAGIALVTPCPRHKAAEDCGGGSAEART